MRRWVLLAAAVLVLLGAALFASRDEWPWRQLPPEPPAPPVGPTSWVAHDTLKRGESLGDLFERHGLGALDLSRIVELFELDPRRLRPGLAFQFGHVGVDSLPDHVTLRTQPDQEVRVVRQVDDWSAERRPIQWVTRPIVIVGRIASSLYDAMDDALASEPLSEDERIRLAWDLADVFAWQVDFSRDIQPDDRFSVVLERSASERGERRIGRILASELSVANRTLSAFRFETADGRSQFFDSEGVSLRRAFLRAPVEFRRIASRFSRSRLHPILRVRRSHQGIDFSASSGTPVLAAADGVVTNAAWSGGYGRLVELRHKNGVSTRYAHLRGFARGIRAGARVQQGDVIGFVGATGLATAPHLHYEFRQNGTARDPNRVDLGSGAPIAPGEYSGFLAERRRLEALLRGESGPSNIAGSE